MLELLHLNKKLHLDGKLNQLVDKDLKGNFDRIELDEIVQVALLCTQFNPSHRPKMSEVLTMLEGDGMAEKWKAVPKGRDTKNPKLRKKIFIFYRRIFACNRNNGSFRAKVTQLFTLNYDCRERASM